MRRRLGRFPLLVAALLSLAWGVWLGLLRVGWRVLRRNRRRQGRVRQRELLCQAGAAGDAPSTEPTLARCQDPLREGLAAAVVLTHRRSFTLFLSVMFPA